MSRKRLYSVFFRFKSTEERLSMNYVSRVINLLKRLYEDLWLNSCILGECSFGLCTIHDRTTCRIGIDFLSIISSIIPYSIDDVIVCNSYSLECCRTSFTETSIISRKFEEIAEEADLEQGLGYLVKHSKVINLIYVTRLDYILERLKKVLNSKKLYLYTSSIDCYNKEFKVVKVKDSIYYSYVFYYCRNYEEYRKLYTVSWLLRATSRLVFGIDSIVKPLWKKK